MRVYDYATMTSEERRVVFTRSNADIFNARNIDGIRAIYDDVRRDGDAALVDYLWRFHDVSLTPAELRVTPEEIAEARRAVPRAVQDAIAASIDNVRRYNERLLREGAWLEELSPGMILGEKSGPIDRVGLYIPAGKGSFPSVMVYMGTPAVVAGVREVVVVTPPVKSGDRAADQAVLVVCDQLGIGEIYRANGPSGIAALALGTNMIRRVRKIVGPGSPAVQAAKILAQIEGVEAPMLYGPSEGLILADDSADPTLVAADLLNEAEHGHDSAAILVTPSHTLVEAVQREVATQLAALPEPRRAYAASATTVYGGAVITRDLDEAIAFTNEYAPEHMQVATRDALFVATRIENAGEILVGQNAPIAAANFAVGIPTTLPTGGFAAVSSGITAHSFRKRSSIAYLTRDALAGIADTTLALAEFEGFPQHAAAIRIRGLGEHSA